MDAIVRYIDRCKEVTVCGTPYERGLQYGRACREEILLSVRNYTHWYSKRMSWEEVQRRAMQYLPAIREAGEEYIEEMQGIADGAGVKFSEIMVINSRSEPMDPVPNEEAPQECTAFSVFPPATANGAVLAGQNWDLLRAHREAVVILRILPCDGKPGILMFPEAGMIGAMGMNDAGIGLTLNALSTLTKEYGLPLHIRMRKILEQKTLGMAFRQTVIGTRPSSGHLIITHKDGVGLGMELDPTDIDVLQPENGVMVHTNHFVGPKFAARPDQNSASSYIRYQRILVHLKNKTGLTTEHIKAALRDHAGYPDSICTHSVPTENSSELWCGATNFSLIMDLVHGTAEFAYGNPCESEYITLHVNER